MYVDTAIFHENSATALRAGRDLLKAAALTKTEYVYSL
jgi:hypothetical protein